MENVIKKIFDPFRMKLITVVEVERVLEKLLKILEDLKTGWKTWMKNRKLSLSWIL